MNYSDSLTIAISHMQDWDIPEDLLPLTICNEASLRSGFTSDHLGYAEAC
jgi:hypothetical protein